MVTELHMVFVFFKSFLGAVEINYFTKNEIFHSSICKKIAYQLHPFLKLSYIPHNRLILMNMLTN